MDLEFKGLTNAAGLPLGAGACCVAAAVAAAAVVVVVVVVVVWGAFCCKCLLLLIAPLTATCRADVHDRLCVPCTCVCDRTRVV